MTSIDVPWKSSYQKVSTYHPKADINALSLRTLRGDRVNTNIKSAELKWTLQQINLFAIFFTIVVVKAIEISLLKVAFIV